MGVAHGVGRGGAAVTADDGVVDTAAAAPPADTVRAFVVVLVPVARGVVVTASTGCPGHGVGVRVGVGDGVMHGGTGVPGDAHGSGGVTGVSVGGGVAVPASAVALASSVGVDVIASAHGGEFSVWLPSSQYGIDVTVTHNGDTGFPVGMQSGSKVGYSVGHAPFGHSGGDANGVVFGAGSPAIT